VPRDVQGQKHDVLPCCGESARALKALGAASTHCGMPAPARPPLRPARAARVVADLEQLPRLLRPGGGEVGLIGGEDHAALTEGAQIPRRLPFGVRFSRSSFLSSGVGEMFCPYYEALGAVVVDLLTPRICRGQQSRHLLLPQCAPRHERRRIRRRVCRVIIGSVDRAGLGPHESWLLALPTTTQ
jgi:hypothetical protein